MFVLIHDSKGWETVFPSGLDVINHSQGQPLIIFESTQLFASRWLHLAAIVFISRCIVVMSVRREARPRRGRAGAVASFWRRSDADNSLGFMPDSQMREENNDDCGKLKGPFGDSDWKALHKVLHKKVRGAMLDIMEAVDLSDTGASPNVVKEQLGKACGKMFQSAAVLRPVVKRAKKHFEKQAALKANGGKKKISEAKRKDGQNKAGNLTGWKAEVAAARQVLRTSGYKGTMSLKPGLPLHNKILELRQSGLRPSRLRLPRQD